MVRLSTRGRYSARIMLELALRFGNGPVLLKEIAKTQGISVGYLEHIMPPLKAAGLVRSSRGAHGGYTLARQPSEITLGEVVRVVEGSMSLVECVVAPKICSRSDLCVTRDVWGRVSEKIAEVLNAITLEEMVDRQKEKPQVLMYDI
ncbi:MAG TPA: Rrf2 family transcriptional regulator [Spirochaetota bacterium]|nr:Rrf2 family transcriptional regulator [Spirochaetota bacterium]